MASRVNLENVLNKIGEHVEHLTDAGKLPAQFIRDIHRQWQSDGGKTSGKLRHSHRYLDDLLRDAGTHIKSLVSKLTGKTDIKQSDAIALIRILLSHWPKPHSTVVGEIEYKPLLTETEIGVVAHYLAEQIKANEQRLSLAPMPVSQRVEEIGTLFTQHFEEADALITVSPERVLITQSKTERIGFRDAFGTIIVVRTNPDYWYGVSISRDLSLTVHLTHRQHLRKRRISKKKRRSQ